MFTFYIKCKYTIKTHFYCIWCTTKMCFVLFPLYWQPKQSTRKFIFEVAMENEVQHKYVLKKKIKLQVNWKVGVSSNKGVTINCQQKIQF